jgi:hypothetical protein
MTQDIGDLFQTCPSATHTDGSGVAQHMRAFATGQPAPIESTADGSTSESSRNGEAERCAMAHEQGTR